MATVEKSCPIPQTGNYYAVSSNHQSETEDDFAAHVIHSLTRLYLNESRELSDKKSIFAHVLIPGELREEIHSYSCVNHCAVLYRGSLFSLVFVDQSNNAIGVNQIKENITNLKQQAEDNLVTGHGEGADIAIFTGLSRLEWKKIRQELQNDIRSKRAIEAAESSAFIFSIDDDVEGSTGDVGSYFGSGNTRWFDHSLNISIQQRYEQNYFRLSVVTESGNTDSPDQLCDFMEKLKCEMTKPISCDQSNETKTILTHHPASISAASSKNVITSQPIIKMAASYRTAIREAPILISHLMDSAGIAAVFQIAAAVAYFKIYNKFGLCHHIAASKTGSNAVFTVSGSLLRTYLQAVCNCHPDRVYPQYGIIMLLKELISELRKGIIDVGRGISNHSPLGHYPAYTSSESRFCCSEDQVLYCTPRLHTNLHFTHYTANQRAWFSFVWCRGDFDELPDTFISCLNETQVLLCPTTPLKQSPSSERRVSYIDREII